MASQSKKKLNATTVNSLKATGQRYRVWDTEIIGFHVRVSPKGKKSYGLYYRHNGVQKDITIGTHGNITADEARKLAKTEAGNVSSGKDVIDDRKKAKQAALKANKEQLGQFLESQYFPWVDAHLKSAKETRRLLGKDFKYLNKRKLTDITQKVIQEWATEKLNPKDNKAPLSASTVNRRVKTMKAVLSKAVEWGVIDTSPLAGMKSIKVDSHGRVRFLSGHEEKALREALDSRQAEQRAEREQYNKWRTQRHLEPFPILDSTFTDYLKPMVLLAINTGMRRGEIFNLQWSDVNLLEQRQIKIRGEGAKSSNTRYIPLNAEAFMTITQWKKQTTDNGLVFPSPVTSERFDNITSSWGNLMSEAKISDFRFHDLRHHFASKLVMAGVDLNTVRELLGHASIEQTLRYAHLAPEHKAAAVAMLNKT